MPTLTITEEQATEPTDEQAVDQADVSPPRLSVEERNRLVDENYPLAVAHAGKLLRAGRIRLGEVDDVIQACVLGMIRALETWRPERAAFSTWCHLHFKNALRRYGPGTMIRVPDWARAEGVLPPSVGGFQTDADGHMREPPDDTPIPVDMIEAAEETARRTAAVAAAIEELPEPVRETVVACGFHGASYASLSRSTGLSVEGTRQRWQSGLRQLRARLDGRGLV